ncbi:MAG: hypothetical protein ACYDGY_09905 [Acidimicrobiales bacterium]
MNGAAGIDPFCMCEVMLGIPGVRVLAIEETPNGLSVEIETSTTEAWCSICHGLAEAEDEVAVDLGEHFAMGQPVQLIWRQRQWRCTTPGCIGAFVEKDEGIDTFLARSPHSGGNRSQQ